MTDFPWSIGDNDIQSKGIKAWSDRQQKTSEMQSYSQQEEFTQICYLEDI